jgi:LysM repeat protein
LHKFIFKDTEKNTELVLPVTPPSFEVSHGINIETINIHTIGDVILPGYGTLPTIKIDCMLPARKYSFNQPSAKLDPYGYYIKKLEKWCDNHTVLRFIVSGTSVNEQVLISEISYGEKDGSGDVYASINLYKYKKISAVQINKTGSNSRSTEKTTTGKTNYVIKSGDTLGSICRKYYGNASLNLKLASYNGIKNANLIYAGKAIKLPDRSLL